MRSSSQHWSRVPRSLRRGTRASGPPMRLFTRDRAEGSSAHWRTFWRRPRVSWQMHARRRPQTFTILRCSSCRWRMRSNTPPRKWPRQSRATQRAARRRRPPRVISRSLRASLRRTSRRLRTSTKLAWRRRRTSKPRPSPAEKSSRPSRLPRRPSKRTRPVQTHSRTASTRWLSCSSPRARTSHTTRPCASSGTSRASRTPLSSRSLPHAWHLRRSLACGLVRIPLPRSRASSLT
mmetsp:Transcript_95347/g.264993  ORF Transcript_95347/g.264993 Transcript_95347/m.264993 type:complete len:235 (+) Transcript_95347:631-1335(+)